MYDCMGTVTFIIYVCMYVCMYVCIYYYLTEGPNATYTITVFCKLLELIDKFVCLTIPVIMSDTAAAAGGERGAEEQDAVEKQNAADEQNAADADANNSNAVDISSKPGSASVKSLHVDDDALAASKSSVGQYLVY